MSFLLDAIVMQRARDARRGSVEVGGEVVVPHAPDGGPKLADLIAGPTPDYRPITLEAPWELLHPP